jgi:hypothetical protein
MMIWCFVDLSFQGPFRGHLLELLACTGMQVQRNMNPQKVTHVMAIDIDADTEKLKMARTYQ